MRQPFPCILVAAALLAGCTRATAPASIQTGAKPLEAHFPARELELIRTDPGKGEIWTTKLVKNGPEMTDWRISGHSAGLELMDRRAHGSYLEHLMSTLRTLQVSGVAPRNPVEAYGLLDPAFALRWPEGELRIGNTGPERYERFAQFLKPGEAFRDAPVYVVKGSALQMLEHLDSFTSIRQQVLTSPLAADDVDEIEVFRSGKARLYAQREGEVWTDRKHKPIRLDLDRFLEIVTHARIQEFVDDPAAAETLARRIESRPLHSVLLKDRKGKATRVDLAWSVDPARREEHLYAIVSGRPGVFRLFREVLSPFESLVVR